jgi:hypothetical protein
MIARAAAWSKGETGGCSIFIARGSDYLESTIVEAKPSRFKTAWLRLAGGQETPEHRSAVCRRVGTGLEQAGSTIDPETGIGPFDLGAEGLVGLRYRRIPLGVHAAGTYDISERHRVQCTGGRPEADPTTVLTGERLGTNLSDLRGASPPPTGPPSRRRTTNLSSRTFTARSRRHRMGRCPFWNAAPAMDPNGTPAGEDSWEGEGTYPLGPTRPAKARRVPRGDRRAAPVSAGDFARGPGGQAISGVSILTGAAGGLGRSCRLIDVTLGVLPRPPSRSARLSGGGGAYVRQNGRQHRYAAHADHGTRDADWICRPRCMRPALERAPLRGEICRVSPDVVRCGATDRKPGTFDRTVCDGRVCTGGSTLYHDAQR